MPTTIKSPDKIWHFVRLAFCPHTPCKALLNIIDDVIENVLVLLLPFPREVVTLIALERRVQTHLLIGLNVLSPNKRNRKQMYLWTVQRLKPKVRCTKTTPGTAQLYHCSQVQVLRPPPPWLISSFWNKWSGQVLEVFPETTLRDRAKCKKPQGSTPW